MRFELSGRDRFGALAAEAGFTVRALFGDYNRSEFDPGASPVMIWELARCEEDWRQKIMSKTLTCAPELLQKDLAGRTYIVTGANSGIGLATTAQLVHQGAHVVAACRRTGAGKAAMAHLAGERGSVAVMELDLGSLASVRTFTDAFKSQHARLDGLVNNAGIMNVPQGKTADGFESQLGVNYLAHFLLTELLLDVLKASAPARIVCVASAFHVNAMGRPGEIHLDDLQFARRKYDPWAAYAQSKLANVLHASELARRLEGSGVSAFSLHPGWVRSNLIRHSAPAWVQNVLMRPFSGVLGMISNEEGAQTTLHCLLDDGAPAHSGEYYSQKGFYPDKADRAGGWPMRSPNPQAHDRGLAARLYERSRALVGLSGTERTGPAPAAA